MIVTIEQINAGIIKFVDSQIIPKANDIGKLTIIFVAGSIPNKVANMISQFKATGMIDDLFDENGNIKLDDAYKRAKEAMSKVGKVMIPGIRYNVDSEDIDILYNLIKQS